MAEQKRRTLLNIDEDMVALDDLLAESGGDISDEETANQVEAIIAELEADLENKADGYAAYIRELESRAKARQEEADRLKTRAKQDKDNAQWLKMRLLAVLDKHGRQRIETKRFRLSVANNGGKLPVRIHVDAAKLPDTYRIDEPKADTDAIRDALQNGQKVEGCELGERGKHLRIN